MSTLNGDAQNLPFRYRAYLIRLWQEGDAGCWRASAHSVDGEAAVRFATLQALFSFLLAKTSLECSLLPEINAETNPASNPALNPTVNPIINPIMDEEFEC